MIVYSFKFEHLFGEPTMFRSFGLTVILTIICSWGSNSNLLAQKGKRPTNPPVTNKDDKQNAVQNTKRDAGNENKNLAIKTIQTPNPTVRIELYDNEDAFTRRLNSNVNKIDFDDIDASEGARAFKMDFYQKRYGVQFLNRGGQYVGTNFQYPSNYVPRSKPNMYAPGPKADGSAKLGSGGNKTKLAFFSGSTSRRVAGVGIYFIDVNYPGLGKSGITVIGPDQVVFAKDEGFYSGTGKAIFRGMISIDEENRPVSMIESAELVNGSGWPEVYANEGVVMDDLVFAIPGLTNFGEVVVKKDTPKSKQQMPSEEIVKSKDSTSKEQMSSGTAASWVERGNQLRLQRLFEKALECYNKAYAIDPSYVPIYDGRAETYRQLEQFDKCLLDLGKWAEFEPRNAAPYLRRAFVYRQQNDLDRALTEADRGINLQPDYGYGHYVKSQILVMNGDLQGALTSSDRAVRLVPNNSSFRILRATVCIGLGMLKQARIDTNEAGRIEPTNFEVPGAHYSIDYELEHFDRCLAHMDRANQMFPNFHIIMANRAEALARTGNVREARPLAEKAFTASKQTYVDAIKTIGICDYLEGKYEDAIQRFILADKLANHSSPIVLQFWALTLLEQGNATAALDMLKKSNVLASRIPSTYDAFAKVYGVLNKPQQVKESEEMATKLRKEWKEAAGE
jgi:tetratricopeptide (TPR) repeat protein